MKNYRVDQKDKTVFAVIEQPTGLEIKKFRESKEAHAFKKRLNGGAGFDGFTPPFILVKVA